MSLISLFDRACLRLGWIIRPVPSDDTDRIVELVDLIRQDNADGRAYRHAVRFWHPGLRPIVERFAGHETRLEVEGPCYISCGISYALGSQILHRSRWYSLQPKETNELAWQLREAIDETIARWVIDHADAGYDFDNRGQRNRAVEDHTARELIADDSWSRRSGEQASYD